MIPTQDVKVVAFQLGAIATNATSSACVDTQGYEHARVLVMHEKAAATNSSAKWTSLQLGHATTTHISNATAINGATGTTNATAASTEFVLPAHNDANLPCVIAFEVPLANKERYLHVKAQASNTYETVSYVAILSRGKTSPNTDAESGAAKVVYLS